MSYTWTHSGKERNMWDKYVSSNSWQNYQNLFENSKSSPLILQVYWAWHQPVFLTFSLGNLSCVSIVVTASDVSPALVWEAELPPSNGPALKMHLKVPVKFCMCSDPVTSSIRSSQVSLGFPSYHRPSVGTSSSSLITLLVQVLAVITCFPCPAAWIQDYAVTDLVLPEVPAWGYQKLPALLSRSFPLLVWPQATSDPSVKITTVSSSGGFKPVGSSHLGHCRSLLAAVALCPFPVLSLVLSVAVVLISQGSSCTIPAVTVLGNGPSIVKGFGH